jgi:hypothetical protein
LPLKVGELPALAAAVWSVCRFHGARGGAPSGKRNGMYRHGDHTRKAVESILRATTKKYENPDFECVACENCAV